jgi:hypothetical protein
MKQHAVIFLATAIAVAASAQTYTFPPRNNDPGVAWNRTLPDGTEVSQSPIRFVYVEATDAGPMIRVQAKVRFEMSDFFPYFTKGAYDGDLKLAEAHLFRTDGYKERPQPIHAGQFRSTAKQSTGIIVGGAEGILKNIITKGKEYEFVCFIQKPPAIARGHYAIQIKCEAQYGSVGPAFAYNVGFDAYFEVK